MDAKLLAKLENIAKKTIEDCYFCKKTTYFGKEEEIKLLLPSGDEKYYSFWLRDCALMAESGLVPSQFLKKYIEIFATCGQNGSSTIYLDNGLEVPPYAMTDHVNYDGKPVFFPGTYKSGQNQGVGDYGFYPPFCDNFYYITMVCNYIKQSGNKDILNKVCNGITIEKGLELAFNCYNIDKESQLCVSDALKPTVDWGFHDAVRKTGKLLMSSLLRYTASIALQELYKDDKDKFEFYSSKAQKIKDSVMQTFYDENSGWFYSSTGMGKQKDVWATAYAVYMGITKNQKTLEVLYQAYINKTAVVDGYVRQILNTENFSHDSAWEVCCWPFNVYQNGGYWATPTGWYAYALYLYNGKTEILQDFACHTERFLSKGAPFEWINDTTTDFSGQFYGTSGVMPYVGALKIANEKR